MPRIENKPFRLAALLAIALGGRGASPAAEPDPAADLAARVASHGYPAIFEAWSPIENLNRAPAPAIPLAPSESRLQSLARHDLVFITPADVGLVWNDSVNTGLSTGFTPASVARARDFRARLLARNPRAVLLVEIRYHDAQAGYFPDDSPWWLRDAAGRRVRKTQGTALHGFYLLDLAQAGLRDRVAGLCAAAVDTGAVDGCMLDWWAEDSPDHRELARQIRGRIGDRGLILVNVNGRLPTRSAPYLNGMFMEGFGAPFFPDWRTAANNLEWATTHLRPPAFTAFEMWYPRGTPTAAATGRNDLRRMRFATTLSLCYGNGYVLYSDPFPAPGHPHDWYGFWQPTLGAPAEAPGLLNPDGSSGRKFQHGEALCNPPENRAVTVAFPGPVTRQSTGEIGTRFSVLPGDGEIFVYE